LGHIPAATVPPDREPRRSGRITMAYVIVEPCIEVKDKDSVEV
jgi:hypothetical protein